MIETIYIRAILIVYWKNSTPSYPFYVEVLVPVAILFSNSYSFTCARAVNTFPRPDLYKQFFKFLQISETVSYVAMA